MADNNKQVDGDILRAADIIPSSNKNSQSPIEPNKAEIPKFDLAQDIMAEHRKATATKRKAPTKPKKQNPPPKLNSVADKIQRQPGTSPQQEQIIREIVARDIERLLRGDTPL